jgi:exopolyphosphatase/guanosine-5'-triphosphate,3'-diphosphate pyrophosphatase
VRGLVVERTALETAVRRLLAVDVAGRPALDGVSEKRADILPAGGIVVLAAMEAFGVDRLTLCDWGLREGVLLAEAVAVHA